MQLENGIDGNSRTKSLDIVLGLLPLLLGLQLIIWIAYLPAAQRGNADFRVFIPADTSYGQAKQVKSIMTMKLRVFRINESQVPLGYYHLHTQLMRLCCLYHFRC